MSPHSLKAKRRHPNPMFPRTPFVVSHITFEVANSPDHGPTFALIAGTGDCIKDRRPLFTGTIDNGMADELEALASAIRRIEPARRKQ